MASGVLALLRRRPFGIVWWQLFLQSWSTRMLALSGVWRDFCSPVGDMASSESGGNQLATAWPVDSKSLSAKSSAHIYSGLNPKMKGKAPCPVASIKDSGLVFWQHGLLGIDLSFAMKQNCRNVLHLSFKLNNCEEESELRVWTMQPDGTIARVLLSAAGPKCSQPHPWIISWEYVLQSCVLSSHTTQLVLIVSWPRAVAMSAQMSTVMQYQSNYCPVFKMSSVLTHTWSAYPIKAGEFIKAGIITFVVYQVLHHTGPWICTKGFPWSLISARMEPMWDWWIHANLV